MIKVDNIVKAYRNKQVLNGVCFCAHEGECIAIAGGNGCGKTTLLSILAGALKSDSGDINIDGKSLKSGSRELSDRIAYVPQENPIIPELSAKDNYKLWFKGKRADFDRSLNQGIGRELGITEFLKTPAGKLSGGQKKRLSIAAALSGSARILILDEPGAALDLEAKEQLRSYVRAFVSKGGTVIITSHETEELALATKLYVMKDGRLNEVHRDVSPEELVKLF